MATVEAYRAFTARLVDGLVARTEVLGVVALGSMAERDTHPDRWSDHDFFVVVPAGLQPRFRQQLDWLPDVEQVALAYQETEHGLKVLYRDAHLLELAVFSPEELSLARVNRYRVLLDRSDVAERMARVRQETEDRVRGEQPDDAWLVGQLLTALLVGVARHRRGERLSGHRLVAGTALGHLLALLARHLEPEPGAAADDLDPYRRFESLHPAVGRELGGALTLETPAAAVALLALARRELGGRVADFPAAGAAVVERFLADVG